MSSYNLFDRDCTMLVKVEAMSAIIGGFLLILYALKAMRSLHSSVYPIILNKDKSLNPASTKKRKKSNMKRSNSYSNISPVGVQSRRLNKTTIEHKRKIVLPKLSVGILIDSSPKEMKQTSADSIQDNNNINIIKHYSEHSRSYISANKKRSLRRSVSFTGKLQHGTGKKKKNKSVKMLPILRKLALPMCICIFLRGWMRFLGVRNQSIFVLYYIFNFYAVILLGMAVCIVAYYVLRVMHASRLSVKLRMEIPIFLVIFTLVYPFVFIIWAALIDRDWPLWIYVIITAIVAPICILLCYTSLQMLISILEERNMSHNSNLLLFTFYMIKIGCVVSIPWSLAALIGGIIGLAEQQGETFFLHDNQPEDQKIGGTLLLYFTMIGHFLFINYLSKARSIHDT